VSAAVLPTPLISSFLTYHKLTRAVCGGEGHGSGGDYVTYGEDRSSKDSRLTKILNAKGIKENETR
jgi:hypothetical protein